LHGKLSAVSGQLSAAFSGAKAEAAGSFSRDRGIRMTVCFRGWLNADR
jgi:hypothetical protein